MSYITITMDKSEDNAFSTSGIKDFTSEETVFEIAIDTKYEMIGVKIDITGTAANPFTIGATLSIKLYTAYAAAGASYRQEGETITRIVGTDSPSVAFSDWADYAYSKVTIESNNGADTAVDVPIKYIKKPLE